MEAVNEPVRLMEIEKELAGIKEWLPKFYPTVMKQYEATCRGERDLFF